MTLFMRLLVVFVESLVQMKRRDDEIKRQDRMLVARDDPGAYLRGLGRVRKPEPIDSEQKVCSNSTGNRGDG